MKNIILNFMLIITVLNSLLDDLESGKVKKLEEVRIRAVDNQGTPFKFDGKGKEQCLSLGKDQYTAIENLFLKDEVNLDDDLPQDNRHPPILMDCDQSIIFNVTFYSEFKKFTLRNKVYKKKTEDDYDRFLNLTPLPTGSNNHYHLLFLYDLKKDWLMIRNGNEEKFKIRVSQNPTESGEEPFIVFSKSDKDKPIGLSNDDDGIQRDGLYWNFVIVEQTENNGGLLI